MRIVYTNGEFLPENEAKVSIFDRGFLFADAVYEGISALGGKLIDFEGHIKRLERSIGEIDLPYKVDHDELLNILRELVKRNEMDEGLVYLQVSRGPIDRDFVFDNEKMTPSVIAFTQSKELINHPAAGDGISVITIEDKRWGRCDIKTVQLLYSSLSKMEAVRQGADDAWYVRDGVILEGTSNNAFIVDENGTIVTKPLANDILPGITRAAILAYAEESGTKIEERTFTIEDALRAKEAFITSATTFLHPVVKINGQHINDGKVGPASKRIREIYIEESLKKAV